MGNNGQKWQISDVSSTGIPSASSVASDISVLLLGSETLKNEVSELKWAKEYMYLLDIFYMDPKRQTRIHKTRH